MFISHSSTPVCWFLRCLETLASPPLTEGEKSQEQIRARAHPRRRSEGHLDRRPLWPTRTQAGPHMDSSAPRLLGTSPRARLESPLWPRISLSKYPKRGWEGVSLSFSLSLFWLFSHPRCLLPTPRGPIVTVAGYRVTGVCVWGCFDEAKG